jgi:hypothetical protein
MLLERAPHRRGALGAVCALAAALAGCGLQVASPDLFSLTRTGPGAKLTLLVNDSGTIRCNGKPAQPLPDPLLLQARSLATTLATDAQHNLRLAGTSQSVFSYKIELQQGSVTFSDISAHGRSELTEAEAFALAAAQGPCGLQS